MEDRKRVSEGDESESKRHQVDLEVPVNAEDVELFQREALFRALQHYKRERNSLEEQLAAANIGDDKLREELQKLTKECADAHTQLERARSVVTSKVLATGKEKSPEPESKEEAGNDGVTPAQLVEAQTKIAGLEGEISKLNEYLEANDEARKQLETKLLEAEEKIKSLPQITSSLESRLRDANSQIQQFNTEITNLHAQIHTLKSNEAAHDLEVKTKFDIQIQDLEKKLASSESDVTRIRTHRDDLLSQVNVLKAEVAEHRNESGRLQKIVSTLESTALPQPAAPTTADPATPPELEGIELGELKEKYIALNRQKTALANEMNAMEQGFAQAHIKAKQALKEAQVAEQKAGVLNSAKVRSDEKYISAMRARDMANSELAKTKTALQKSAAVLSEQKLKETQLTNQLSKYQRQIADAEAQTTTARRDLEAKQRQTRELEQALQSAKQTTDTLREQIHIREEEKFSAEKARRHSEVQVEKLSRQAEAQRAVSGLGSKAEVQEQLESLRSIAMCQVCQKNWKDSCISTCGHTMCNDCIKSRLAARMRNCPMCNGHFASSDVLSIHL